jgi:hypothetical protein
MEVKTARFHFISAIWCDLARLTTISLDQPACRRLVERKERIAGLT